ncbi:hypothetical protein D3C85_743350 [compost metagenome]
MGLAPFVVDEGLALVLVGNEAATHGAGLVQRATGIHLQAVVIPGTGLAGDGHGRGVLAAFAYQVDRAAGASGALKQAGRTAQHFHAIKENQVLCGPVTQRIGVAWDRHTVVLPVIDLEATRGHDQAFANALNADQAGGLVDRILEIDQVLVVHLFAGHDGDRLRNFLEGMGALADGHRFGRVGTRAFGGGVGAVFDDVGRAQLQRSGVGRGRLDAEVALFGHSQLQAAAVQRLLHGFFRGQLADDRRCLFALYQRRLQRDDVPALAGDGIQRTGEWAGGQVEGQGLRLRQGRAGQGCQGNGDGKRVGPRVEHSILLKV